MARTVRRGNYSVRIYDDPRANGRQAQQILAEEAAAAKAQAELDRIAAERRAIAEQQQRELAAAQAESLKIQQAQAARAEELQSQARICYLMTNEIADRIKRECELDSDEKQDP